MTLDEAKTIFLNRGYIEVNGGSYFGGNKWRESVVVISEWLKEEPCTDAINRQAVLDIDFKRIILTTAKPAEMIEQKVKSLPPVNPQPKIGHWIWELDETPSTCISPYELNYAGWVCSCCHEFPDDVCEWDDPDVLPPYKFCSNCGAKMESEEKR